MLSLSVLMLICHASVHCVTWLVNNHALFCLLGGWGAALGNSDKSVATFHPWGLPPETMGLGSGGQPLPPYWV